VSLGAKLRPGDIVLTESIYSADEVTAANSGSDPDFGAAGFASRIPSDNSLCYALFTQSRLAGLTSSMLRQKGYEVFLPSYSSKRRWSDRMKVVEAPLFPGYMFCRFDVRDRLPVLSTPGMISIVGAGAKPIPVDEEEIAAVRQIVRAGLATQTWPFLRAGARVRVHSGPLRGLEGILVNTDKIDRLVVSVTLLQRSVAVEIDRQWASPCGDTPERS